MTDNIMTKRKRTDNIMTKRKRTDNIMTKRKRTDNIMTNRKRTDNIMTNRKRTDNIMTNRKRTKRQTMIYKTLHRKLKIEQHEHHTKTGVELRKGRQNIYIHCNAKKIYTFWCNAKRSRLDCGISCSVPLFSKPKYIQVILILMILTVYSVFL
jgi:hypothetical protein